MGCGDLVTEGDGPENERYALLDAQLSDEDTLSGKVAYDTNGASEEVLGFRIDV